VRPKRSHGRAASCTVAAGVSGREEKKRAQNFGEKELQKRCVKKEEKGEKC
jgi:hypothetical protein